MNITLNGEAREVDDDISLRQLMEGLGIKPEITAAQRNDEIVDRKSYSVTTLHEGDSVELIRIVGGG